jgi:hypothetical protein
MTLLSVVKDVCATVGVLVPQSVFSNITSNRTMQEMLALANEMAQRIAYDTRDWTMFKTVATFTGDGVADRFALPSNYKRMLLTANVWRSTSQLVSMRFVPDADEWLHRRTMNYSEAYGEWTMMGGKMLIWPIMAGPVVGPPAASAVTATFLYLDKNCINLTSGGRGDQFMADGDTFALDERTLKLGMIWQWKAQKGSPYSEDLSNYGDALTNVMGRDSPSPIIVGRTPLSDNARVAIPTQTIYVPGPP